MKAIKPTFLFAPVLAAILNILPSTSASAATLTYTNTATVTGANLGIWTSIVLPTFDSNLGTLTGVVVTLNYAALVGSFAVTPSSDATVSGISTAFYIKGSNTDLGYGSTKTYTLDTTADGASVVSTTPDWTTTVLSSGQKKTFSIVPDTYYVTNDEKVIAASYYGAYTTDGAGTVTFSAYDVFNTTVTAGTVTQSVEDIDSQVSLSVTYTYDAAEAVPEPSTWAMVLGGIGTLAVVQRIRRRNRMA